MFCTYWIQDRWIWHEAWAKIHLVERNTLHRAFNGNDRFLARSPWMNVWQGLWVSQMDCWGESSEVWGGWLGWCRWASIYCSQWGSPVGLLCLSKNPSYTHTHSLRCWGNLPSSLVAWRNTYVSKRCHRCSARAAWPATFLSWLCWVMSRIQTRFTATASSEGVFHATSD